MVDASVVGDLVLGRGPIELMIERLFAEKVTLHAPHLLDVEVLETIRKHRREMSAERALKAIEGLSTFPIERHSHELLLGRMWELRENIRSYDAAYVALAELLDAPLVTRDLRLSRSSGHSARIEVIA